MSRGAHLTFDKVNRINEMIKEKTPQKEIATACSVSVSTVARVANGKHALVRLAEQTVNNVVQVHGTRGGSTPITPEIALMVKRMLDGKKTYKEVAEATGISASTVSRIFAGEHWSCNGSQPKRRGPVTHPGGRFTIAGMLTSRGNVVHFERKLTEREVNILKELLRL